MINTAEAAMEDLCERDLSTYEGALHLANCIRVYWARQGVTIEVSVIPTGRIAANTVYGVKTSGIPTGRK
jgi:hypothetical protein